MKKKADRTRTLDCVEMMHQGASLVREELEGKSVEEQIAYWRQSASALHKRQEQLRESHSLSVSGERPAGRR